MWELGIVTDEIDDDLANALRMASRWGIRRVEFRTIWGKGAWNLNHAEKKEALVLLRDGGFEVVGIGSQFLKIPQENLKIEYDTQIEALKRAMEAAHVFGAKIVRVLSPLLPAGGISFGASDPITDELVSQYLLPVRLAEKEDLTLAVENQSTTAVQTSSHAVRLREKIGSLAFGVLWDPANALAGGEADAFPAGYDRVCQSIAHLHIKDAKRDENGKFNWTVVGEGEFDLAGQLKRLTEDNYHTTVTLEPHLHSHEKLSQSVKNIRRVMSEMGA